MANGEEPKVTFRKLIASEWGTITTFVSAIAIGVGIMVYMFKTFPTVEHIVGRFAQKSEISELDDKYEQRLREFEKKVLEDVKTFKRRYRKDKIITLAAQLDVVKYELYRSPEKNEALTRYKEHLEKEIVDLLEKMDKED